MAQAPVTAKQLARWKARDQVVQDRKLGTVGSTGTVDNAGTFVPDPPRQDIFDSGRQAPKRAER